MNNDSKLWSVIGKISVVVAIIAAIVGIWSTFNKKSEDLSMFIESGSYTLDPKLNNSLNENFNKFRYSKLREYLELHTNIDSKDLIQITEAIEALHQEIWKYKDFYLPEEYNGLSLITVSNTGDLTAKKIKIDIPTSGIALVTQHDKTQKINDFNITISIGDLRPNNKTTIAVWTKSRIDEYEFKDISLSHENGIGNIYWVKKVPLFWAKVIDLKYLFPVLVYIVFMAGLLIGSRIFNTQSNNTKQLNRADS